MLMIIIPSRSPWEIMATAPFRHVPDRVILSIYYRQLDLWYFNSESQISGLFIYYLIFFSIIAHNLCLVPKLEGGGMFGSYISIFHVP